MNLNKEKDTDYMREFFDVIDENGNPTGEIVEREIAHQKGIRHRTAHVWLMRNKPGDNANPPQVQILLQKRSDHKDSFPGCYDISSAGHIPAGCDFVESALRELSEELGLSLPADELHALGDFHKAVHTTFHGRPFHDEQLSRVFYVNYDLPEEAFTLQESEVSAVLWMDLSVVKKRLTDPSFPNCIFKEELDMLPTAI